MAVRVKGPSMVERMIWMKLQRLKSGSVIGSMSSLVVWGAGVALVEGVREKRVRMKVKKSEIGGCIFRTVEELKRERGRRE